MDLWSAIILLVIVTDPFGNLPIVTACLEGTKRPLYFISREILLALIILIIFLLIGPRLMSLLGLSEAAMRLAGGIILFIIALKMIFPTDTSWLGIHEGEEPLLFPLAVPLIAGPSALATVILFSAQHPEKMGIWLTAIVVSMAISLVVFALAPVLHRFMGHRGLAAMERLMGLLLTAISVEMILSGMTAIGLI
jgi:multiple antibiotic resistance protein